MFILEEKGLIEWPVVVKKPVDGGATKEHRFTAIFSTGPVPDIGVNEKEFLSLVVVGWKDDIRVSAEEAFPFSKPNLDRLLLIPYIRHSIMTAYHNMMMGIPEEVEKN